MWLSYVLRVSPALLSQNGDPTVALPRSGGLDSPSDRDSGPAGTVDSFLLHRTLNPASSGTWTRLAPADRRREPSSQRSQGASCGSAATAQPGMSAGDLEEGRVPSLAFPVQRSAKSF